MGRDILLVVILAVVLGIAALYLRGGFEMTSFGKNGPYFSPRFEVSEPREREENLSLRERIINKTNKIMDKARKRTEERTDKNNKNEIISKPAADESAYKNKIIISAARAKESEPLKEYITIFVSSRADLEGVNISGWEIKNSKGEKFKIGGGSRLPYSSKVNIKENIFLKKKETANIITGRSSIGASFLTNVCVGYFEQFQDFFPSLRQNCPRPENEAGGLDDVCLDYIEKLPACKVPVSQKPLNLNNECLNFIEENINYNACVKEYKADGNFYTGIWMVYLNRDKEIFKQKREIISLYDESGKFINSVSY